MAYGLLIYKEITSPEGTHRLEVHKDGYTGTAVEIDGLARDSIVLSKNAGEAWDAITTSVLTFALYDTGQIDYAQFFTPNATLFKVVLKLDGVTRWTGYLTPDSYSENLVSHDTITLTARDNLGRLNDYDFSLAKGQMMSARAIINAGLAVAGVAMDANFTTTKVATSPATMLVIDGLVNTTLLQGMTWHAAITLILVGMGMTLSWNENNGFDVRDITQAPSTTQSAFFISKSGYKQIRPAWKNVTAEQDYGLRENFYEGQFSKDDCGTGTTFTVPSGSKWSSYGTMNLLNPYKGAANPSETIFIPIQGGDALTNRLAYTFVAPQGTSPIKMSFRANNTAWIWQNPADAFGFVGINDRSLLATSQSGGTYRMTPYYIRYRLNIFATVGNTTYVLRDNWQEYDPSTIEEPYLYFVMPAVVDGYGNILSKDADQEVEIYVGQMPGPCTVNVVFYAPAVQTKEDSKDPAEIALAALTASEYTTPYAKISDVTLCIDETIGGRTQRVTVNAEHNIQSNLSVGFGEVPLNKGNALAFLGGLFYTDIYNTPLTVFKRSSGASTTYDLLELVSRERISFNNNNYNLLSGTMKANTAFSFAKGISFGNTDYRIISASLSVLSNTLSVQVMQTEPQFATADYTIEEVDGEGGYSSRGSYSGSGVPQGTPQGGVDWFVKETYEEDGETKQRLKLNPDYTGMYAEGWITAGGLGSGSGEAGGSLATLADVTLTNLAAGDILRYDATTSHWLNGPLAVALASLTDVAIGTPSNGQALVYDSTLGKWKPGNVGGGGEVVVVSEDATIGTSLTLLATVAGTPIKAKIAAYLLAADFTAANIVSTLGNTAVNRATKDSDGSTINHTYGAGFVSSNNRVYLQAPDNTALDYFDASDILPMLGLTSTDTIATAAWVGQQGYLTSSAISDMATMTWVGQQGYLTSSAISDMATKTWVGQQGFITSSALSGYMETADYTGNGTLAVNRAKADADGNTIKTTYAASLVQGTGKISLVNNNSTEIAHVTGAEIVSAIGTNAVARATADASGNTITTSYLRKDTDDIMAANLTIGSTSSNKNLTICGGATSSTPALTIKGGTQMSHIWRDSNGLNIFSSLVVDGNIKATGYIDAGASASDRRLKKDIKTMDFADADYVLTALRPVTFAWNEKASELGPLSGDSRGFLADEYNRIIPNATRKMWGEYDAIDYHQVIPYLVAGWQSQQRRIEALSEEIEKLRRRLGDGI